MKLRYGGDLQIGDFIMIANSNYTTFGWFCGTGRGTVQYYHFRVPGDRFEAFQNWQAGTIDSRDKWLVERFKKYGFGSKLFYKEYVYGSGLNSKNGSRVVKLIDPESIFTEQEDLESYRKSKEALIHIKFPVK
jgi:hypothetical protein